MFFASCGGEPDFRSAERLQFYRSSPPNVKSDFEVFLGNLEAKKYKGIHGPVKRVSQKSFLVAKDENGNFLEPHFSGKVEIHYLPDGSMADFSSYDSSGSLNTLALTIHKANRREIYVHLFDSDRDFVFFLSNDNRIIEEGANPYYRQSPIDSSWTSADGHFSWEEGAGHRILAATGVFPSVSYRHIYAYDENDSLVRVTAFDLDGKRRGELERVFKDGKLRNVFFRFDESLFSKNPLNYSESYGYDSIGRLSQVITHRAKGNFPQDDTVSYLYSSSGDSTVLEVFHNGSPESKTVYDAYGNAVLMESFGAFVYEGANGTAESYEMERIVRQIEYEGEAPPGDLKRAEGGAKRSLTSLAADAFFRSPSDSSALYCTPSPEKIPCCKLNKVPGTLFLNYIESVTYKNASEVFLERNSLSRPKPVLVLGGECALVLGTGSESSILFENSQVNLKRNPFGQFCGDTVSFSPGNFPCAF